MSQIVVNAEMGVLNKPLLKAWLNSHRSPITRKQSFYKLRRFLEMSGLNPLTMTSIDLEKYIFHALNNSERKYASGTIKGQIIAVKSLYKYLATKNPAYTDNPVSRLAIKLYESDQNRIIKVRKRALPLPVVRRVMNEFRAVRKETGKESSGIFLFKLLINSGLRISEALSLEYFDPKKAEKDAEYINYIKIINGQGFVYVLGKNRRAREFWLNKDFTKYLLTRGCVPGEFVIKNRWGNKLSSSGALYLIKYIGKKFLGEDTPYKWCVHSLRHTFITLQIKRGESALNIAKTVGHSAAVLESTYLSEVKNINQSFVLL
jgi:site-specific recombinase XerD